MDFSYNKYFLYFHKKQIKNYGGGQRKNKKGRLAFRQELLIRISDKAEDAEHKECKNRTERQTCDKRFPECGQILVL